MAKGKYQRWLEPDGLLLLRAWARDGLSNDQIAKKIGVSRSTLQAWKVDFPDFSDALARGREPYDVEVENAMHDLCLGYTAKVHKTFKLRHVEYDDLGHKVREWETLGTGIDEVHVPANVNAQKFWLANRRPDVWRERREAEAAERPNALLQSLLDLERRAQS